MHPGARARGTARGQENPREEQGWEGHEHSQRPKEMAKLPASQVSGRINRLEGRRYSARIFVWHKPKQRSKARGALGPARRSQKGTRMARARTEAFRPRAKPGTKRPGARARGTARGQGNPRDRAGPGAQAKGRGKAPRELDLGQN